MAPRNNSSVPQEKMGNYFDLYNGKFTVNDVTLISEVPSNVSFSPFCSIWRYSDAPLPLILEVLACSSKGGFLGFYKEQPSDRLMNSFGKFIGRDFLSIFRFKTWWSTMWVGNSGSDIQMETQWLLLDVPETSFYVIIIPIPEGGFRSALHPGSDGHVIICAESGSTRVKASSFDAIAYVHGSENPYDLMKEAYRALRVYLNTFRLLEEKTVPNLVDRFGWCTWDAFYLTVETAGVWRGMNEFAEAGISLRFLILDDGWQSFNFDGENPREDAKSLILGGPQMTARLHRLDECKKFRKYSGGSSLCPNAPRYDPQKTKMLISKASQIEHRLKKDLEKAILTGVDVTDTEVKIQKLKQELSELLGSEERSLSSRCCGGCSSNIEDYGFKAFTRDLRIKFKGLDDIYVWHALCGAWGGVRPGSTHLNSKIIPCKVSPGLDGSMNDLAVVKILEGGIGLLHPDQAGDLFDSMHSYLAQSGITGVKVDVIHTLEYAAEEYGGRVELAKACYKGLDNSVAKNFSGTGMISSMQQCSDFFFLGTKQNSLGRVGEDFWGQDPYGDPSGVYWLQGLHIVHCAYNSLWMGQMIQPDWDMFQSDHLCAKYHAASRAICGVPIYVSDTLGSHDFDLLKMVVYPDGTTPKCRHFALPTRDCLFKNPLLDQKTMLKIWNLNKYGGVIGAFNCQGAGWDPKGQQLRGYPECYGAISSSVDVSEIEWDQKQKGIAEEYVMYLNQAKELLLVTPESAPMQITVQVSSFELFSFVPLMKFSKAIKFAPIGLTNMFNSGGTIQFEIQLF